MAGTPIVIHFYDEESKVVKTFERSFIPWKVLKEAVKMAKSLKPEQMEETDIDSLANLVVATFGNQFTVEELNEGADVGEMMAVMTAVVAKASNAVNPTPPPSTKK
jgi:hypothetical protein